MTAPIGTAATIMNGVRELSQVTNTYAGYLQSGGAAYTLTTPWQADKFEWFRYTTYGTNDKILQGVWFRDFPAGDSLLIARGTTTLTSTLETTNGVTVANTSGGFTARQITITGLSAGVVTAAAHGLTDGDRVMITKVIGTVAPEVNNKEWVVDVQSSSTFKLYDVYGVAYTQVGSYTSSGQATDAGPELGIVNNPITYKLTLGSAIMGTDNDVIYFVATKFNNYVNLGDVA